MIAKKRLEELIKQGATIYELDVNSNIYALDLTNYQDVKMKEVSEYSLNRLYEHKEDAEWDKEFGCVERTERLVLPPWEEFLKLEKIYSFKSKNNQIVVLFIDGNTIYLEDENWNILREPLTKENYTNACRKAKELFLGESNVKD